MHPLNRTRDKHRQALSTIGRIEQSVHTQKARRRKRNKSVSIREDLNIVNGSGASSIASYKSPLSGPASPPRIIISPLSPKANAFCGNIDASIDFEKQVYYTPLQRDALWKVEAPLKAKQVLSRCKKITSNVLSNAASVTDRTTLSEVPFPDGKRAVSREEMLLVAIDLHSANPAPYNNLAWCLSNTEAVTLTNGKKMTRAMLFKRSLSLSQKSAEAFLGLVSCLPRNSSTQLEDGKIVNTESLLKRSIALDWSRSDTYTNLGMCLKDGSSTTTMNDGSVLSKTALFVRAIHLSGENHIAFTHLGACCKKNATVTLENGQIMTKEQLFRKAVSISTNPRKRFACNTLGWCLPSEYSHGKGNVKLNKHNAVKRAVTCDRYVVDPLYHLAACMPAGVTVWSEADQKDLTVEDLLLRTETIQNDKSYAFTCLAASLPNGGSCVFEDGLSMSKEALLKRAASLDPSSPLPFIYLALCLERSATTVMEGGVEMSQEALLLRGVDLSKIPRTLRDRRKLPALDRCMGFHSGETSLGDVMGRELLHAQCAQEGWAALQARKGVTLLDGVVATQEFLNGKALESGRHLAQCCCALAYNFPGGKKLNEKLVSDDCVAVAQEDLFKRALLLDPNIPLAYKGLAQCISEGESRVINGVAFTRDQMLQRAISLSMDSGFF